MISRLQYGNVEVQVVTTQSATAFYDARDVEKNAQEVGHAVKVWKDQDEWSVR